MKYSQISCTDITEIPKEENGEEVDFEYVRRKKEHIMYFSEEPDQHYLAYSVFKKALLVEVIDMAKLDENNLMLKIHCVYPSPEEAVEDMAYGGVYEED